MTENQKLSIQTALRNYTASFPSQAKAANSLESVSEATVIHMLNGKWENISDAMWRKVQKQVNNPNNCGRKVDTDTTKKLLAFYELARMNGEAYALTGPAGCGKTFTARWYADQQKGGEVYVLECSEFWNKKYFLLELLKVMGKSGEGMTIYTMINLVVEELRKQDAPLIIMDEVDKLKDEVLYFFITLYNKLNGLCGLVWTSTDYISTRIQRGLDSNKKGYTEIRSRIGSRFIELKKPTKKEVTAICAAYDVTSDVTVAEIINNADGDLRRVNRLIRKELAEREAQLKPSKKAA